jgi:hypothetical protein
MPVTKKYKLLPGSSGLTLIFFSSGVVWENKRHKSQHVRIIRSQPIITVLLFNEISIVDPNARRIIDSKVAKAILIAILTFSHRLSLRRRAKSSRNTETPIPVLTMRKGVGSQGLIPRQSRNNNTNIYVRNFMYLFIKNKKKGDRKNKNPSTLKPIRLSSRLC